jgi:hypothetical protein
MRTNMSWLTLYLLSEVGAVYRNRILLNNIDKLIEYKW